MATDFLTIRSESYARSIRKRAESLRKLADEIDRAADAVARVGTPEYRGAPFANNLAWIAHEVQHAVLNAIPNLNLDALTTAAYDIDSTRDEISR
jgi:acyl-CoA reductase-like NAD-dependent aldehyde dehydrogenase